MNPRAEGWHGAWRPMTRLVPLLLLDDEPCRRIRSSVRNAWPRDGLAGGFTGGAVKAVIEREDENVLAFRPSRPYE
jgi:hypothetical protein